VPLLEPAYASRYFSNFGPVARAFESEVAARYSSRGCVGVANATLGLTAALLALGAEGDVLLPSFTFPATAHAVALAGCEPRFCDVSRETWELDGSALRAALAAARPAAVVHVRSFGLCRDLGEIELVCSAAGVPLVVDSAAAFGGGVDGGGWVGSAGVCEVFSLHATKAFAVGEGGLVVGEPGLVEEVRTVVNFALRGGDVVGRGLNAKLDEFAASRGLAMLARLDDALASRRACADRYRSELKSPLVVHPFRPGLPPWQTYPVQLADADRRPAFLRALAERGVEARPYYTPALHRTTAFRTADALPATDALSASVVCLPVYPDSSEPERAELAAAVRAALDDLEAALPCRAPS
jgi:dTDP-4-amino-4,6-dideoxygalactose transaminase